MKVSSSLCNPLKKSAFDIPLMPNYSEKKTALNLNNLIVLSIIFLILFVGMFLVSVSDIAFQAKIAVFSGIVVLYFGVFLSFYLRSNNKSEGSEQFAEEIVFTPEIESRLLALEEANRFFGTSLKFADMFRLVSSRINELVPLSTCVLFLPNESQQQLKVECAVGCNSGEFAHITVSVKNSLAGKTLLSGKAMLDSQLLHDVGALPPAALSNLTTAVSVPLAADSKAFGVLVLYGDEEITYDENSLKLLEAVGERIVPFIKGAFAFERSVENALTDSLTNLPNERAFYLVLENQIAEAQRFRGQRALTILTIDIKKFSEINSKLGHVLGNQILTFVAALIKNQLREMDFLARSASDEFLVILPTASENIAAEIIERLRHAFNDNAFALSKDEMLLLELNFGAASFWKDGETAPNLLQKARLNKKHIKSRQPAKVVWFPQ